MIRTIRDDAGQPLPPVERRRAPEPKAPVIPGGTAEVATTFFHDARAGHYVYRLEDPLTGRLLLQVPGEDLLRFFAALREALGRSPDIVA